MSRNTSRLGMALENHEGAGGRHYLPLPTDNEMAIEPIQDHVMVNLSMNGIPSADSLTRYESECKEKVIESIEDDKQWTKQGIQQRLKKTCTTQLLYRRLPFIHWIRTYTLNMFLYDFVAGITVGLTVIPQGIAYAAVAGLPLQYGLYSSFMGPFIYIFLGSVKEISIGPTAIMALMTFSYARAGGAQYSILLAFLSGCIELIAGLLNLGFMIDFISAPVISGFCSAAALTVASTQVKGLFGLKFQGSSFIEIWTGVFGNFLHINPYDTSLGMGAIVVLLIIRKLTALKKMKFFRRIHCLKNRTVDRAIWFFATSRNAIMVICGCLAAYFLEQNGLKPFSLTGDIKPGLPPFEPPQFWFNKTLNNSTEIIGFTEICSEIGAAIGLIPLIAVLEQVAIAKAFSAGKRTDATQEMIALGVGNIVSSFFGSMPITASFGRSSVQSFSGVQTTMANLFSGILVLLALGFLMPCLSYIPKAILAAVIITSVIFMVEYEEIKPMWKARRIELFPFILTFLCCLFVNMEYGILIGAGVHLLVLAYIGSHPKTSVLRIAGNEIVEEKVIIKADRNIYFPGVEKFRNAINKVINDDMDSSQIIIDLKTMNEMDYTTLKMLKSVVSEFHKKGKVIYFVHATSNLETSLRATLPEKDIVFLSEN